MVRMPRRRPRRNPSTSVCGFGCDTVGL